MSAGDPADLPGILADHGIRLKSMRAGATQKVICPRCHGGSQKEPCLSVTIDRDGDGVTWKCHRGKCGWTEGFRVHDARPQGAHAAPVERTYQPPPAVPDTVAKARPAALYRFFADRGISAETVDCFGCYVATRFIPSLGERPCIVFPYTLEGRVVNRKYRPPEKQPQAQEKAALPTLFNVDAITSFDRVIWVEGEPDAMAVHEAGYPQVVTLKDGAGDKLRAEDDPARADDKRFYALNTHAELLAKIETFILAGDADGPGEVLREELARRLGRHRCLLVTWPQGCKDAGDVLRLHGAAGVQAAIESAKPYPIEGLQELSGSTLEGWFRRPPFEVMRTGVATLDRAMRWPAEGRLIVVTGIPGSGKSPFLRWLQVLTMKRHARKWIMFSPEMAPWEDYVASVAEVLIGLPFRAVRGMPSMSAEDRASAEEYLRDRLWLISSDAEDTQPTLAWIFERARAAVLRFGATDLGIDPWNEIEYARGNLTETEYVGRALQACKAFAQRHGVNVWIVAHPVKMQAPRPGGDIPPPGLYDISGGANWANKADLGITVHREDKKPTSVILRKAKFVRWGVRGAVAQLDYDVMNGQYFPAMADLASPEDE